MTSEQTHSVAARSMNSLGLDGTSNELSLLRLNVFHLISWEDERVSDA